eukprot:RCo016694
MNEVTTKPLRPDQARAIATRYGYEVNWDRSFDLRTLHRLGGRHAYLKSYIRYLQDKGEWVPMARQAARAFMMLYARGALPLQLPPESASSTLQLIVGTGGYLGSGDDDWGTEDPADPSNGMTPTPRGSA